MESLWVALIGVGGTLAGSWVSAHAASNRDRVRLKSEEQRERDRLEAQSRADREARLFEHRRTAIEAVVSSFSLYDKANLAEMMGAPPRGEEAYNHMNEQLAGVRTYCTAETVEAAERIAQALHDEEFERSKPDRIDPYAAFRDFQAAAQTDLGATS